MNIYGINRVESAIDGYISVFYDHGIVYTYHYLNLPKEVRHFMDIAQVQGWNGSKTICSYYNL